MTLAVLAKMMCLASGIFGRPAWDDAKCSEHAEYVLASATLHEIDPVLMVATNIIECDMREQDRPVYRTVGKRKVLVGYDACPMGVRIIGLDKRSKYDARGLYELAARKMDRWKRWCAHSHRGQGHHFIAHYNEGNPDYAAQVLGVAAVLKGRPAKGELAKRTAEIVRRLARIFVRGWNEVRS